MPTSLEDIQRLVERQKGRCANIRCQKTIREGYAVDFIVPLRHGGANTISNICLFCPPCKEKKIVNVWKPN